MSDTFVSSFSKKKRAGAAKLRRLCFEQLEARSLMAAWISQGPFSANNGQVEGITNRPVSGAVHAVVAHPTNPNILYIGSVNGGIWRTNNATSNNPSWSTTTDSQSSGAIGALAYDQADPTYLTLWAGNGRFSSYGRIGNQRAGLLKTIDGGNSWTRVTGGGVLVGKNVSGLVANGNTIVVSVNLSDTTSDANVGIFRSTDGGASFSQVNDATASRGLPLGRSFDLIADPTNPNILYTSNGIPPTPTDAGIYKSIDGGSTWARVSNATMNGQFAANTSNAELAAGRSGEVYAAILNAGRVVGLYRSPNGGSSWTAMDIPSTNENGIDVGLNPGGTKGPISGTPDEIAGGQGAIHFSMVADPTNANIVYVGGDRQPRSNGDAGTFPNSIGATNFTGRLFRGDASRPAGAQFVHLTHSNTLGPAGGGTASNSAPHADSRDMVFDASGNIIQVDDGGVYRRTSPRTNSGNWFSMNGNLAITEIHDIAYDSVSNVLIGGTQDNGNVSQNTPGASVWNVVSQGDGGDVVVDELTLAASNQTIRYTSAQNLGGLRRRVYNAAGTQLSSVGPALNVTGGGNALVPAFRTPIQLNAVAPSRLIIQASNSTYESLDQANNLFEVGPGRGTSGIEQDAIAYGGRLNGITYPDVLWVASGSSVLMRTTAGTTLTPVPTQPVTSTVRDLVIDPDAYSSIAIATSNTIRWSTDAGFSWTNITGNLLSLTTDIRSLAYIPGVVDAIVAGTGRGVYVTSLAQLGTWVALGSGFPNSLTFELEYDANDNVLVAGTLGRGAWLMPTITQEIDTTFPPYDFGDAPDTYRVTAAADGPRHARLGPTLGALRDTERDGVPTLNAVGDNVNGLNDEDGVVFHSSVAPGYSLRATVSAPLGGFLNAWLDSNLDGTFSSGERLISDLPMQVGLNRLNPIIPSNALPGSSFIRFRITEGPGQVTSAVGAVSNGEVEDYAITIEDTVLFELSSTAVAENSPLGTVVGAFTTIAEDTAVPFTYELVTGPGDTDNVSFSIVGNELHLNTLLDFETKSLYSIRVRTADQSIFAVESSFLIQVTNVREATIVGRSIFYNRSPSSLFGNGAGNPVTAVDPSKTALLPGQTATIANYTNYERGINGILVDVIELGVDFNASSFSFATWDGISSSGFVPVALTPVISGFVNGGVSNSTRFKLEFDDFTIINTWLRVTVAATVANDLAISDVFYFGNAVGDVYSGNTGDPVLVRVNATDSSLVRQNLSNFPNSAPITSPYDFNKDGRVNAIDTAIVRQNAGGMVIALFHALPDFSPFVVLGTPEIRLSSVTLVEPPTSLWLSNLTPVLAQSNTLSLQTSQGYQRAANLEIEAPQGSGVQPPLDVSRRIRGTDPWVALRIDRILSEWPE